jgi:hypothetical protein
MRRPVLYSPLVICSLSLVFIVKMLLDFAYMHQSAGNMSSSQFVENTAAQYPHSPPNNDQGWKDIHVFVGTPYNLSVPEWHDRYSQVGQDKVVMKLFRYKKTGFFLDLAANHAVKLSNTFRIERDLQWKGICIEPNAKYWDLHVHRTCQVVAAVVGATRMEPVNFVVPKGSRAPSGGIEHASFDNRPDGSNTANIATKKSSQTMYTVPLLEILTRYHSPLVIDYMSLDVEGAEYFIMKDFPFHSIAFKC